MKARVKATGEIIDVRDCGSVFYDGAFCHGYVDINRNKYLPKDLEFDGIDGTPPDYWTRLEHQYAGMAMQAMLSSPELMQVVTSAQELLKNDYAKRVAVVADRYARALVEKLKEKEEKRNDIQ